MPSPCQFRPHGVNTLTGTRDSPSFLPLSLLRLLLPLLPGRDRREGQGTQLGGSRWGRAQGPCWDFLHHWRVAWEHEPSQLSLSSFTKAAMPSGTLEGEVDVGRDRVWGSQVPLTNDQINVVIIAAYSDSQHLSPNTTSHLMETFPPVLLKDTLFYLVCKSFSVRLLHTLPPSELHVFSTREIFTEPH